MKSRLLIAAASAALMAAPSLASAQDDAGWYLRGNAGYGTHTDVEIYDGLLLSEVGNGLQSEGNGAFSLGAGYDFGNNWRVELDGDSLWTDLGSIGQTQNSAAKLRTNTAMLNAIYDFNDFGNWAPYIGAGVGLVQADLDAVAHDFIDVDGNLTSNPACVGARVAGQGLSCSINDDDTALGYQLLAGLGYDISENLTWDTHYTYLDAQKLQFDAVSTNGVTNDAVQHLASARDVGAHTLLTGFRYKFGQPAAAVPVPVPAPVVKYIDCPDGSVVVQGNSCPVVQQYVEPAPQPTITCWDGTLTYDRASCPVQPAPPQTYTCWDGSLAYDQTQCPAQITQRGNDVAQLCGNEFRQEIIYYEFDKGQSAETRNTINRILDIGQYCNVDNIRVVGHTDTSGSAAYNLSLSKRRAKDARDELVRQGIARERITSSGKGETEPFVPTGDGVKEQLNRRTEVLISLGSVGVIN